VNTPQFIKPTADTVIHNPLSEAFSEACWQARYGSPSRVQLLILAAAASSFRLLLTHPMGNNSACRKLRLWRNAILSGGVAQIGEL